MFYIIDCFTGWLLEVDLGVIIGSFIHCSSVVRVAYGCSFSHRKAMGITTRPSQWQNKVGTY